MTAPAVPTLAGTRCVLRALRPADVPALLLHVNDAAVVHNLYDGFPHPYTQDHADTWCDATRRDPTFGLVWAITQEDVQQDVQQGLLVGCIGVMPQQGMRACNAEVGYWLGQALWGRGIAAEALSLATAWVWQALPAVQRITAPIFVRNPRSQAVAAKAGYVLEALQPRSLLKGGEVIDVSVYAAYRP